MRRAFISPTKYVQGENELLNLGYFVKTFGDSALLIAHPDDVARVKDKLESTKQKFNITLVESGKEIRPDSVCGDVIFHIQSFLRNR